MRGDIPPPAGYLLLYSKESMLSKAKAMETFFFFFLSLL
jgi:hypothetical protein